MAREGKNSLRTKRKVSGAAAEDNEKAKRQKTCRDEERPVVPSTVVSNVHSQSVSTATKVVSLKRQPEVHISGQRDRDCTAMIPIPPTALSTCNSMQDGITCRERVNERIKIDNRTADSEKSKGRVGSGRMADTNATKRNAFSPSGHRLHRSLKTHQNSMVLWKRFVFLGIIAYLVDFYREYPTSLVDISVSVYNSEYNTTANTTLQQEETLPSDTLLVPHKTITTISRHLLDLDEYERQKAVLAATESDLKLAIAELADSRHDAVASRFEAKNFRDAYQQIVVELDRRKEELADNKQALELLSDELSSTQTELDRTRSDLVMATIDIDCLSDELEEAYKDIDDLYKLLETQEMVATNALNFVATTAIQQQQEAAAHAMNFVTTLAMKQKNSGCPFSDKESISSSHD